MAKAKAKKKAKVRFVQLELLGGGYVVVDLKYGTAVKRNRPAKAA